MSKRGNHYVRPLLPYACAALLVALPLGASPAAAQTAQFTIDGMTTTVPLRSDGSGGWYGSGLSPLPQNIVVHFASAVDTFRQATSLSVNVSGQATGPAFPVTVLFSVPLGLPSGPTVVTATASGANFPDPVGVAVVGEVSDDPGESYQTMGVDLNTSVSLGSVTVGPHEGPESPPWNAARVTGMFSTAGDGQVLNTAAEFTIQPGGPGSPPPAAVQRFQANGAGHFTSLQTGPVQFTLNAVPQKGGTVRGTLVYREPDQDFGVRIAIDCLNVVADRAVVTGIITAVENPELTDLVGLPAAFAVRDTGRGRQTSPDLASDLWVLFADCFDPVVVQLTRPFTALERGSVVLTPLPSRDR